MDAHRDDTFNVKPSGFGSVLRTGLKEDFGAAAGCSCCGSWMGHLGLNDLAEVDRASNFAGRVERAGTASYAEFNALDGDRAVPMHMLAGGRAGAKMDGGGLGAHATVGSRHASQATITEIDGGGGRSVGGRNGVILLAK